MKLSLNWLNNFLPIDDLIPEEVASKLTMSAFEVEDLQKKGASLKGPILVGEILDIKKHPNADKLSVTTITTDGTNRLQIVCGATNIKISQKVPVSLPGATVKNRKDGSKLDIKISKIRQLESFGMLCAPAELGLDTDEDDGILILPNNLQLGLDVIDYLCLKEDVILEVAARSNRGDALSVWGLSRELSGILNKKGKELTFRSFKFDNSVNQTKSNIENLSDTYLFYTVTIENIKISNSPEWLKRLLESVGIRSVNNIVDITNYINFTYGQPMHTYDKAKLKGDLVTRQTRKNEEILTLDGKLRSLKEDVLVIADERGPVAVAGIMGGKDSEVTDGTSVIVLEAAVFSPVRIRRASRKLGLTTEASKRFERGVDSNFTHSALLKALELIEDLAKDKEKQLKISPVHQAGNPIKKEIRISLDIKEVSRILGISLEVEKIISLLTNLGFSSRPLSKDKIEVLVPSYRINDISRPIDLIEEIARLYGYDNIPVQPPKSMLAVIKGSHDIQKTKEHFLSCGFSECYLSSLIGEETLGKKEFPFEPETAIKMTNPLSREHSLLRQSLLPGLLIALKSNQSYQISPVKLFEIGTVYKKLSKTSGRETGITELIKVGLIANDLKVSWFSNKYLLRADPYEILFFSMKGSLESFFEKLRITYEFTKHEESFLHPKLSLQILINGSKAGWFGILHPELEQHFEIRGPVVISEFELSTILKLLHKEFSYKKTSSQPIVLRDITADLPKKFGANEILKEIGKIKSGFVQDVSLINIYNLDQDNRSLTFRLKMQHFEETLSSAQLENEINRIKSHLTACFLANFRV